MLKPLVRFDVCLESILCTCQAHIQANCLLLIPCRKIIWLGDAAGFIKNWQTYFYFSVPRVVFASAVVALDSNKSHV